MIFILFYVGENLTGSHCETVHVDTSDMWFAPSPQAEQEVTYSTVTHIRKTPDKVTTVISR